MRGCRGSCMVARGHAWLLGGGHAWLAEGHAWLQGKCVVSRGCVWLPGGMCGCQGVCMVVGGMHGCRGACMVVGGGMHRIRQDTVNERAVRILLECILVHNNFEINRQPFPDKNAGYELL